MVLTSFSRSKALAASKKAAEELGAETVLHNANISKVSIVGLGMRSHAGVAATMFEILGREGITVDAVSTSEIKVSCLVASKYTELAVRLKPGVDTVTLKEFAFRIDARPSNVSDALAQRDRKRLAAEHLIVLLRLMPESNRAGMLNAIAGPLGYRVERVVALTPEERAKKAIEYVEKNAPGLLPGLVKEIGR